MERSCCAVIVAAGGSTRMGCPKQTLVLEDAPVIAWTLHAFEEARSVSSMVLVIREEDRAAMENVVARYGISKPVFFAAGGKERQLSVYHGLLAVPSGTEYVAVHDGARLLVTPEEIDAVIAAAGPEMGTALAVRVKDTIKEVNPEGIVVSTPERETLRAVQTPQVFPFARFFKEMERAVAEAGLQECFVNMGYMPHSVIPTWQRAASLLLLPLRKEPEAGGILTGKFFEYLASGSPILAFGPKDGDLAAALAQTGAGTIFQWDEKEAVKEYMLETYYKWLKDCGKETACKSEKIENPQILRYSRREQAARLSDLLDNMTTEV